MSRDVSRAGGKPEMGKSPAGTAASTARLHHKSAQRVPPRAGLGPAPSTLPVSPGHTWLCWHPRVPWPCFLPLLEDVTGVDGSLRDQRGGLLLGEGTRPGQAPSSTAGAEPASPQGLRVPVPHLGFLHRLASLEALPLPRLKLLSLLLLRHRERWVLSHPCQPRPALLPPPAPYCPIQFPPEPSCPLGSLLPPSAPSRPKEQ